jgi:hypothetical protein
MNHPSHEEMIMPIVASYDWDTNTYTQHQPSPADLVRTAWREAVAEVAERAKQTLPACTARVDSAVKIVLAGDVELLTETQARVASQSHGATTYWVVEQTCTCADYPQAPGNFCKHKLAAGLYRRALTLVKAKLEAATNGQALPDPAPSPQAPEAPSTPPLPSTPLPEAPVSITLKATLQGHEVLVTLRGTDLGYVVGSRTGAVTVGMGSCCLPAAFALCRCLSPSHSAVSSPRHVKRSVRISRTALSCMFHVKGYGTYRAGSAFGCGRLTR